MNRHENEEDVSFELDVPSPSGDASSIGWLAVPTETGSSGVIPGWLKLDLPDDPRIVRDASPKTVTIKRSQQHTAVVRRDEMERDAGVAPPVSSHSVSADVLKQIARIPLVYGLVAKVSLPRPAFQFKIEHELPKNVRLVEAKPKAVVVGDHLMWNFGRVDPGQELKLQIVIQPEEGAVLDPADLASFHATYNQALHFQTPVVRPRLSGKVELPPELSLGNWATLEVDVQNAGNWPVKNVIARTILPAGLRFAEGVAANAELGVLVPTDGRKVEFRFKAVQDGVQVIKVELSGSDGAAFQIERKVEVVSPRLDIRIRGGADAPMRSETDFQIEIGNLGRTSTEDYQIDLSYSRHLEVSQLEAGSIDVERRVVTWMGQTIQPGQIVRSPVRFRTLETGAAEIQVEVRSVSGAKLHAIHPLRIGFQEGPDERILDEFVSSIEESSATDGASRLRARKKAEDESIQLVVFSLGRGDYAVPLDCVLEVGKLPRSTPLPNVPEWLVGLTNIRGDIVSLVDLNGFFDRESTTDRAEQRMLVVRSRDDSIHTALVVDRLRGMRGVSADRIVQPTAPIRGAEAAYLQGLIHCEGRLVSVLDIDRLLSSRTLRQFDD